MGQVLILKRDVTNKNPDRRKKRDGWAVVFWEKGSRWAQEDVTFSGPEKTTCIKPLNRGYASPKPWWIVEKEYGFTRDDFTVKAATTWKDVSIEEGDWSGFAGDVLETLIRREAVSLDEVRKTLRYLLDQPDEDERSDIEAWRANEGPGCDADPQEDA